MENHDNEKGFTLVEIIGAIIILGIILVAAIPVFKRYLTDFREDYYYELEKTVTTSGKDFFADNHLYRPAGLLETTVVRLRALESLSYIKTVYDYRGDKCDDTSSYVLALKKGDRQFEYVTCLVCSEDGYESTNKYCDPVWQTNANLKYILGDMSPIYVYLGTEEEELERLLEVKASIAKVDNDDNILEIVPADSDGSSPSIAPDSVDVVDTSKEGTYTVTYTFNDDGTEIKKDRDVIVYVGQAPTVTMTRTSDGSSYVGDGSDWAKEVKIQLSTTNSSEFSVYAYQWYKDGVWEDVCYADADGKCEFTYSTEGKHIVKFRGIDDEGLLSIDTRSYTLLIDITPPKCEVYLTGSATSGSYYTTDPQIVFNADNTKDILSSGVSSGIANYGINSSSDKTYTGTSNTEVYNLSTTTYTTSSLTYYGFVKDKAGNEATCRVTFERQAYSRTCNSCDRCSSAACEVRNSCKSCDHCGGYYTAWSEYTCFDSNDYVSGDTSTKRVGCTSTTNSTPKPYRCCQSTRSYVCNSCRNSSCSCNTRERDCSECGCASWNGWTTTSSCSTSTTKSSKRQCRVYFRDTDSEAQNEYTLTLNTDSCGTVSPTTMTVVYGEAYGELPSPEKTGYTFDGWFTSGGTQITATTNVSTPSNHTLYAKCTPNTYVVTYDNACDSLEITTKNVTYNESYGTLPIPSCIGYAFGGWYTELNAGTKVTSDTIVSTTSDHSIYAKWSEVSYTINFNGNGNTSGSTSSVSCVFGSECTLPSNGFIKTDYRFKGWDDTPDGEVSVSDGATVIDLTGSDSITLYAIWEVSKFMVTFDANGGTGAPSAQAKYFGSDLYLSSTVPTRDGYTFKGWGLTASATTPSYQPGSAYTSNTTITLYAVWEENIVDSGGSVE